jgi:thiosulfate dehydrogenase
MVRGFIVGIIATLAAIALLGYAGLRMGLMPANADAKPGKLERWAAHTSLGATLAREVSASPNPVPLTDANLIAGIKLYGQNCVLCHGAADGKASNVAQGLYQKPPQLASDGVEDDSEGETYWKVAHGIRFTGMPSFGATLSQEQIWQLALFLKHMDALPAAPQRAWKSLTAPAPASR